MYYHKRPKQLNLVECRDVSENTLPTASFLFITRNRCPSKNFENNPLTWVFQTLLANKLVNKINEWVVISDGSNDYIKQNIEWLTHKYNVNIKAVYYTRRKGCSYRRSQGIKLLMNDLFFMGDDDCLYRTDFVGGLLVAWRDLSQRDSHLAVLAPPVLEMRTIFDGTIPRSRIGHIDYEKAWFYHNFDKEPLYHGKIVNQPFSIETFKGVTLGSRKAFLAAGNFPDLSAWENDYSEHLEISRQLINLGYTMYYLPNECVSVTHIQWGVDRNILPEMEKKIMFLGMKQTLETIERASKRAGHSGCRVQPTDFMINRIGSFLAFYLNVNQLSATQYALMEYGSAVNNHQIIGTPLAISALTVSERLKLWHRGLKAALVAARKITGLSYRVWRLNLMKQIMIMYE